MNKVLLALLLLSVNCLYAQTVSHNIYHYSTENGLPTNDYRFVYQDSYGFLWLASYDGLFRWDGYSCKKYSHDENDPSSLDNDIVYAVFEDSHRRLWVGTIEGLNEYNRSSDGFTRADLHHNKGKNPVNAISEDAQHRLWLGTSNGLCQYDPVIRKPSWFFDRSADDVIFCLAVDSSGDIWTGTMNGRVKRFAPASQTFTSFSHLTTRPAAGTGDKVRSIMVDHRKRIWIGTSAEGAIVLDGEGTVLQRYTSFAGMNQGVSVNCIYEDKSHTIWISTGRESLHYINPGDTQPTTLHNPLRNNDRFQSITSIYEDSFGNVWFGSAGDGLFCTNKKKNIFSNFLQDPGMVKGLKTNVITSICEGAAGQIWMGTDRNGFLQFDPSNGHFSDYTMASHGLSSDAVNEIKGDKNGRLWMATWGGGIMEFDPSTSRIRKFVCHPGNADAITCNDVKAILPDDTVIWTGTHGGGLAAYDWKHDKWINARNNDRYPFDMGMPAWINHLYKDARHRLWIGTYGGIYVFDGRQLRRFEHSASASSLSSNYINMITEDQDGHIWIASEFGGLDRFNEASGDFTRMSRKYALAESVKAVVAGPDGLLWLSSNEGLIAFDPATGNSKRYDASDGLQGNSFFHKAVLKSRSGRLYFGGPRGFTSFDPDSIGPIHLPAYFYYAGLYVYNEIQYPGKKGSPLQKVLSFTDSLQLKHDQSFFSVEFAGINLYSPGKMHYAYKLEGLHDQWIDLKGERKVSFTNLDPGPYVLRVRVTDAAGKWQAVDKALYIDVLPPWWKTWWFRLSMGLLAGMAIAGVLHGRVASIKKRNRFLAAEVTRRTQKLDEANQELLKLNNTKDRFFSILAHDLKDPVSALTGISEFMKENFGKLERAQAKEYLNNIYRSAHAVQDLLINLLSWSRTQSDAITCFPTAFSLHELVHECTLLLEQQFDNKNIRLSVDVPATHGILADYTMIGTVIRNILSNSIKFTEYNGRVHVRSVEHGDHITLVIADNGVGMTGDQMERLYSMDKTTISPGTAGEKGTGLGLVIVKEFLQANNGDIRVDSAPGKGSTFHIRLVKAVPVTPAPSAKESRMAPVAPDFWESFPLDKLAKIKGKKILIVDDNKELRNYLRLILSACFEIVEAENGRQGLTLAAESQPGVIITDLLMPVMDGLDLCRELKGATATSHIPVIFLTSQAGEHTQFSGYAAGADAYLPKPVKKEVLIQMILNFIGHQEKMHDRIRVHVLDTNTPYPEDPGMGKLDTAFLQRLVKFIEDNISDAGIDAQRVSKEMGVSRTILYSKIKALTGLSVHEFIKSVRLKQSLKLLLEGEMTISQVAFEVGFSSHSYFDKCFVRQYGMGPKEYVNKKRNYRS
jgi:ligand-binding sensor domain-containing protein/signal transduction histidine kinase/CheY-like chemotaxis protein/AraC-like DNA-binding protein